MSQASPHVENLYDTLIAFAQEMLATHGEFFPFSYTVAPDGSLAALASYDGNEQPSSKEVVAVLTSALSQKASKGEIIAAGLCYDVSIKPGDDRMTDAICMDIEHIVDSLRVVIPYAKRKPGSVEYGQPSVSDKEPTIFKKQGT